MRSRYPIWLASTLAAVAMCLVPGDAVAHPNGAAGAGAANQGQDAGRTSTIAQTRLLVSDMSESSERLPEGVPSWWDWAQHPRTRSLAPLQGYRAFTAWGQLYQCAGTAPTPQATVELRDLQAWVLLRNPSRWQRIQFSSELGGAAFAENYAGSNVAGRYTTSYAGTSVQIVARHNFHFWPDAGRVPLDASSVEAIMVGVEARLEPAHAAGACLVLSVGGDLWKSLTATSNSSASDVGIGRFKRTTLRWRLFTMTTASADALRHHALPRVAPVADDF